MFGFAKKPIPLPEKVLLPSVVRPLCTPSFTIHSSVVEDRLNSLISSAQNLEISLKVAFSFKTNYDFAASKIIKKFPLLAETVSSYEYSLAKNNGFTAKNIILNGPNKGSLNRFLKTSSLVHLDNFCEIKQLSSLPPPAAAIGLRLNPLGADSRFGFDIDNGAARKAVLALRRLKIPVSSIHVHLGSDIYDTAPYLRAALKVSRFLSENGLSPRFIDFGGGYPAHGRIPHGRRIDRIPAISEYLAAIKPVLSGLSSRPLLLLEPGRFLIDDAVVFTARVLNRDFKDGRQILTTDATINMLPSLWYRPATITAFTPHFLPPHTPPTPTVIYGSSCQEHDVLFTGLLPALASGSYLVFHHVGAYNNSMAPDFIFEKPKVYFQK